MYIYWICIVSSQIGYSKINYPSDKNIIKRPTSSLQLNSPLIQNQNPSLIVQDDFKRYEILRDRIVDKIFDVIFILEDSQSSVHKSLKNIMQKNSDDKAQIQSLISIINNNADYLLANNRADSYEFFKNMNYFIDNIENLNKKIEFYVSESDIRDNVNVHGTLDTINRLLDDFKNLEKSEAKFAKNFRQQYVKKFDEKDFF
jgi:hypothetical protein